MYNIAESHRYYIEWKKQDTKEYILDHFYLYEISEWAKTNLW